MVIKQIHGPPVHTRVILFMFSSVNSNKLSVHYPKFFSVHYQLTKFPKCHHPILQFNVVANLMFIVKAKYRQNLESKGKMSVMIFGRPEPIFKCIEGSLQSVGSFMLAWCTCSTC